MARRCNVSALSRLATPTRQDDPAACHPIGESMNHEELMRLADDYARDAYSCGPFVRAKNGGYRSALASAIAEVCRDAERYAWLRDNALGMDAVADPDNMIQVWHGTHPAKTTFGRTLDAAIDAAMERK